MITKIYYQNMFHKRTQISKFPMKSFFHFWCRENALYSAFILDFILYIVHLLTNIIKPEKICGIFHSFASHINLSVYYAN